MTSKEIISRMIYNMEKGVRSPDYMLISKDHCKQILNDLDRLEKLTDILKDKLDLTYYYDNEEDYVNDENEKDALCLNYAIALQNSNNEDQWFIPLEKSEKEFLKEVFGYVQ